MLTTRFTELVGCTVPIQQAPMGNVSNPRLASAVAGAGGLATIAVWGLPPETVANIFEDLPHDVPGAYGANFILRFNDPSSVRACIQAAAMQSRVVECFYSEPDPEIVDLVHACGALAGWQVGSQEEAIAAQVAGCDYIAAQGIEAGGHVRGHISLLALLSEVLDVVDIPVVAAGGIGSGRSMAAALAAGADAVRVGTRFVASEEAEAHPFYVGALIDARAHDTIYTEAYSVSWSDAPHRVLRSGVEAAMAFSDEVVGTGFNIYTGQTYQLRRFERGTPHRGMTGAIEAMSLFAGESVAGVKTVQPAAEIVRELAEEAERLLRRWSD